MKRESKTFGRTPSPACCAAQARLKVAEAAQRELRELRDVGLADVAVAFL